MIKRKIASVMFGICVTNNAFSSSAHLPYVELAMSPELELWIKEKAGAALWPSKAGLREDKSSYTADFTRDQEGTASVKAGVDILLEVMTDLLREAIFQIEDGTAPLVVHLDDDAPSPEDQETSFLALLHQKIGAIDAMRADDAMWAGDDALPFPEILAIAMLIENHLFWDIDLMFPTDTRGFPSLYGLMMPVFVPYDRILRTVTGLLQFADTLFRGYDDGVLHPFALHALLQGVRQTIGRVEIFNLNWRLAGIDVNHMAEVICANAAVVQYIMECLDGIHFVPEELIEAFHHVLDATFADSNTMLLLNFLGFIGRNILTIMALSPQQDDPDRETFFRVILPCAPGCLTQEHCNDLIRMRAKYFQLWPDWRLPEPKLDFSSVDRFKQRREKFDFIAYMREIRRMRKSSKKRRTVAAPMPLPS
jgi:hypothetical protein